MLPLPSQTAIKLLLSFPLSFFLGGGVGVGARVLYITVWSQSHYATKNGLEFFNFLPLSPRCAPLHSVYAAAVLGVEPRPLVHERQIVYQLSALLAQLNC